MLSEFKGLNLPFFEGVGVGDFIIISIQYNTMYNTINMFFIYKINPVKSFLTHGPHVIQGK